MGEALEQNGAVLCGAGRDVLVHEAGLRGLHLKTDSHGVRIQTGARELVLLCETAAPEADKCTDIFYQEADDDNDELVVLPPEYFTSEARDPASEMHRVTIERKAAAQAEASRRGAVQNSSS